MANVPLESRAGRNIGVESLPPFIIAAGGPKVELELNETKTLLEAVKDGLRSVFTRANGNGYAFSDEGVDVDVNIYFDDGQGNQMLIGQTLVVSGGSEKINLSVFGANPNPFNPDKPLILCGDEKLVAKLIAD